MEFKRGFPPKLGEPYWGGPIMRNIVSWGLNRETPGNYQILGLSKLGGMPALGPLFLDFNSWGFFGAWDFIALGVRDSAALPG